MVAARLVAARLVAPRLVAVVIGAGTTIAVDRLCVAASTCDPAATHYYAMRSAPGDGSARWIRRNFRGRPVSLVGGLAAAAGAVGGAVAGAGALPAPWRAAVVLAGGSAALAGGYDDLVAPRIEAAGDKGGRGHLRALRSGRLSGGSVKVAVIGAGALLAAGKVSRKRAEILPDAALIAVTANLINLFDLRPGRALKVALAGAVGLLAGPGGPLSAGLGGAVLAALPGDLGETRMLGDLGANTLGALLGLRLVASGPAGRAGALAAAIALTVASERISFSRVIETSPGLRRIDELGRAAGPAGR